MKSEIKNKVCTELLQKKLVKKYDVIQHSFTDGGGEKLKDLLKAKTIYFLPLQQDQMC